MDALEKVELRLPYTLTPQDSKVRIGLVLLSTDHSLEMEWAKILGTQAMMLVNRLPFSGDLYPESLSSIEQEIANAAKYIATGMALDVLAFACTSSSIVLGNDRVAKLLNQHRVRHLPATNPLQATFAALHNLKAKKVAVFSPYPTAVNHIMDEQFVMQGISITCMGSLNIENDTVVAMITKESIVDGVEKILKHQKPDALFLSCTNLRVFDYIEELESRFGVPVITSNQALYWHALKLKGLSPNVQGYGMLLNQSRS